MRNQTQAWIKEIKKANKGKLDFLGNEITSSDIFPLDDILEKSSINKFVDFYTDENYSFIYDRIKENAKHYPLFKTPLIVLFYFMVKRHRHPLELYILCQEKNLMLFIQILGFPALIHYRERK